MHLGGPGSTSNKPGTANQESGMPAISLGEPMTNQEHLRTSQITGKQTGKTKCSLGTLLVLLEIIAITYHSTIFQTHLFSLYSYLSI